MGWFAAALLCLLVAQDSKFGRKRVPAEGGNKVPPRAAPLDADEFARIREEQGDPAALARVEAAFKSATAAYRKVRREMTPRPEGGDISTLREKALGHYRSKNYEAQEPLVRELLRKIFPDISKEDPKVAEAAARLRELDDWARSVGGSVENFDAWISELAFEVDEAAIIAAAPSDARSILEGNRAARKELSKLEYEQCLATNMYRIVMGKSALKINVKLCRAARGHSKDMHDKKFFSHTSPVPGKRTPQARARLEGTSCGGENICRGETTAWGTHWAWFHSWIHHRAIMSNTRQIGVGEYKSYWTQNF